MIKNRFFDKSWGDRTSWEEAWFHSQVFNCRLTRWETGFSLCGGFFVFFVFFVVVFFHGAHQDKGRVGKSATQNKIHRNRDAMSEITDEADVPP